MNTYRVKYFNSGGYKSTGTLTTDLHIKRENDNNLCLWDGEVKVGAIEAIEQLFIQQLGYIEELTIIDVTLESDA
ncbi:hypothetical protein [Pleionea litopenaei]|uniref:Uncharacterized protein n=1 Tax=Pleionea litopenaei TaxID=3070815 RepID=A0AA51X7I2_9GAMM|nr:hypothetical protein [Pleionea sp. HL-JVS1]WMS87911.1 hypothetical protein Q9312_03080 [Pleionea sp. HL-JVS1]